MDSHPPPPSQLQHSQSYQQQYQNQNQHQSHTQSPAQTPSHSFKENNPYSDFSDSYQGTTDVNNTDASTAANTAANTGSGSLYHNETPLLAPQPQNPPGRFTEEWDATQRGSSIIDGPQGSSTMQRSTSVHSYNAGDDQQHLSRGNTLKKKNSTRRNGSLKRSSSRRSMRAGSVKSLALQSSNDPDEAHSAFHSPVPTSGNPTEILCNRFQSWRKILKDLIAYFREIQTHYEHKSKSLLKLANVSNNISAPSGFLRDGGIDDALQILRTYNKSAIIEANKAREIEEDVILALTGLRSDLQQKIKEIKNLSGDFKNSVDKEMDHTRKAVKSLGDVLGKNELDESSTTGKSDPYLLRMAVDRQLERQLDEENYLHQAYLNLEISGRELESIVVGEIQKAHNAYAGILKREADNSYNAIDELRGGPVTMSKDKEWMHFVTHDDQFVDPNIPLRTADQIHYPGQEHEAVQEIRAGLLERKSKYLKSYTAGWYVLSATHLHEFKSADKAQAPIMSLYLPEQKVGSHSSEGGSSNKFILKGRQTGSMHRGHTWVFRAESHDTMMAWYEDIKALTEKTPEERSQFVRSHSRSLSRSSRRSVSSDGLLDDEEDEVPFSADTSQVYNPGSKQNDTASRRSAGGRFPSDIQVNAQRGLQAPHSPSSISSGTQEHRTEPDPVAVSGALPPTALAIDTRDYARDQDKPLGYGGTAQTPMEEMPSSAAIANQKAHYDGVNPYTSEPVQPTDSHEHHHHHDHNDPSQADHGHHYNQESTQQINPQHQSNDDRTYFAPVVVAGQTHHDNTAQQENYQTQQGQGLSSAAYDEEETRGRSHEANPEAQSYQRYNELGAIHNPTYEDEPTFREANGGAGGNNFNVMAVNAEGFPKLNEVARADSDDSRVPGMEAPFPTFGAPIPEHKVTEQNLTEHNLTEGKAPMRPTSNNARTVSVQTISNLHIPGQYPKGTPA